MKKLIVGGTFDENEGKYSYIVDKLADSLGSDWERVNGGNISFIKLFDPVGIDVLIWMPNISNDEDKVLDSLKVMNPHMILIQSKRVIEKEYYPSDVVGRLLKSHSMLGIMISKEISYRYRVLDPLGNIWIDTRYVDELGEAIKQRIDFLTSLTRVGSKKIDSEENLLPPAEFVAIIKQYGDKFSLFVNAINPNRLLGNASTRCSRGFPAARVGNKILVTKRNVEKTTLTEQDFVEIDSTVQTSVCYSGNNKPSVDTPIQLRLFDFYQNVNYIIHGHVYVKDGLFTNEKVPCGYIEEFDEIKVTISEYFVK